MYLINIFIDKYIMSPIILFVARPFFWLPFIKRRMKKQGMSCESNIRTINKIFRNPQRGYLMFYTNIAVSSIPFSILGIITYIVIIIYGVKVRMLVYDYLKIYIFIMTAFVIMFGQFVFWRDDRYMKYFKIFEKEDNESKIVWCLLTCIAWILLQVTVVLLIWWTEIELGLGQY